MTKVGVGPEASSLRRVRGTEQIWGRAHPVCILALMSRRVHLDGSGAAGALPPPPAAAGQHRLGY